MSFFSLMSVQAFEEVYDEDIDYQEEAMVVPDAETTQEQPELTIEVCPHHWIKVKSGTTGWEYYSSSQHAKFLWEGFECTYITCGEYYETTYYNLGPYNGQVQDHNYKGTDGGHVAGTTTHRMKYTCSGCGDSYTTTYSCPGNPCRLP